MTLPAQDVGELFVVEGARLRSTAWMLLGDRDEAEDAVQDAIATMAARGVEGLERPGAYLRTVVVNECRRRMRQRRPRPGDTSGGDEHLDEHDVEMLDLLRSLSSRKRTAIVLRYYEDLEVNAIAEILDCPPATVSSLLRRALKDMKEMLSHDR